MSRDFVGALLQLNAEKQVSREALVRALEEGIQAAYRRVAGEEDIFVRVEPESGRIDVYRGRYVVDEVEDPMVEVTVDEARETKPDARAGDVIELELLDGEKYGRIGAQTAKQIILQRIREVERDQVFDQFASREGELITGSVSRVEPRAIILDVGKGVEAVLATSEQSPLEHYRIGQPVKAYVLEVRRSARGPQILVSRTHKGFLRACSSSRCRRSTPARSRSRRSPARPAAAPRSPSRRARRASTRSGRPSASAARGSRPSSPSSRARRSTSSRGTRTRRVFVANALSPAQVLGVTIDEEHRIAAVTVPERMLSLAIGREGQNARLAARLTGWRIDIRSDVAAAEAGRAPSAAADAAPAEADGARRSGRCRRRRAAEPAARRRRPPRRPAGAEAARRGADAADAAAEPASEAQGRARPRRPRPRRPADGDAPAAAPAAEAEAAVAKPKRVRKAKADAAEPTASRRRPTRRCRRSAGGAGRTRPAAPRPIPTRSCVACRTARPKRELVRVVRTPGGAMVLDETGRAAGRGAYLCRDAACWYRRPASGPSSMRSGPRSRTTSRRLSPQDPTPSGHHRPPTRRPVDGRRASTTDHRRRAHGQE